MIIGKLNSMFARHGRVMFLTLTVLIIVAFVGFFTPGFTESMQQMFTGGGGKVGTVLDESISWEDLREWTRMEALTLALTYGYDPSDSSVVDHARKLAFKHYSLYVAARKMGFSVGDAQVAERIREMPAFQDGKAFSAETFNQYFKERLVPAGYDKNSLDEAVRRQLVVEALRSAVTDGLLVTESEIRAFFESTNEEFLVEIAEFKSDSYRAELAAVDDGELEAFFQTRREQYRIEPKFKGMAAVFPYAEFAETAANGDESAADGEYSEEVVAQANREAQMFAVDVYNRVREKLGDATVGDIFAKLAEGKKEAGLLKFDWIAAADTTIGGIPEGGDTAQVARAMAGLEAETPVSDAVRGGKAAYVLFLTARQEARPAEMAEVREQVENDFVDTKTLGMARDAARNAAVLLTEGLAAGKSLEDIDGAPPMRRLEPFTGGFAPMANGQIVARLARQTPAGELSPVENLPDGALLVRMVSRSPSAKQDFEEMREITTMRYRSIKQMAAWQSFETWLSQQSESFTEM